MNLISKYYKFRRQVMGLCESLTPYVRRLIRFVALPHCYFSMVNWQICPVGKWQVIKDFAYIFFVLKCYPDNYSKCRFWEYDRVAWANYFGSIYDPYQRRAIEKAVTPRENFILSEDKEVCYRLCAVLDIPQPQYYGTLYDSDNIQERLLQFLQSNSGKALILKPVRGLAGRGIKIVRPRDEGIVIHEQYNSYPLANLKLDEDCIVQNFVDQHPEIDKFHASSINSIRLISMLTRQKQVILVGAYMRFGLGDAVVDSRSQGGVGVAIDIKFGTLNGPAVSVDGTRYGIHPDSGFRFAGFKLPFWREITEMARRTQKEFHYSKLLGQDIAITPKGPVTIELNRLPDTTGYEQICGGIFREQAVWKAFQELNLLINKPSKQLYQ